MKELLKVVAVSLGEARRADDVFAMGGRRALIAEREQFLAAFRADAARGRVRVVRERVVRSATLGRSTAA